MTTIEEYSWEAADPGRISVDTWADSLQEHELMLKAVNSLFPYHSSWILLKFTKLALLRLILKCFSDMSSKVQLHLSGGTKGERELPRGLGCLPVTADILRKETLPQRDTEMEPFYRELMTCVLPVTGILPRALHPSNNMQNNLMSSTIIAAISQVTQLRLTGNQVTETGLQRRRGLSSQYLLDGTEISTRILSQSPQYPTKV